MVLDMRRYLTTLGQATTAVIIGMTICAIAFVAYATRQDWLTGAVDARWFLEYGVGSVLVRSAAIDAVQFCLAASILWLPLHFTGHRHWRLAAPFGALALFLRFFAAKTEWFSLSLTGEGLNGYGWADAAADSLGWAFFGAALAGVMWCVAYQTDGRR